MTTPPAVINRPYGLCRLDLDKEQAKLLDEQLKQVVNHHADIVTSYRTLREQMFELARGVYLQGVLDGADMIKENTRV